MDGRSPGPARPTHGAGTPGRPVGRRDVLLLGATVLTALPVLGCRRGPSPPVTGEAPSASPTERLDLRDFRAVGDGVADDTAAVQALIDATSRTGATGLVPAGAFRCTGSLLLPPGAQLHLDDGARLLKDWAAPPGLAGAFLRNADFAVRSDRVRITGPGVVGGVDHSRTGNVLAVYGDDVELRDFTIDGYAGGQAVMFAGDRGRVHGVRVVNSAPTTGTGGIRVIGGTDFRATACHVESGDDCLQFAPIGDPGALLYDMDISGGRYVGCTGVSSASRFLVATLEWTRGDGAMTASVVDCSFEDCHGAATHRAVVVKNTHSSGAIDGLRLTDCSVDMAGSPDTGTEDIRIQTDADPGGAIRDVVVARTHLTAPVNGTLRIGGPGISDVTFDGCRFTAPSGRSASTAVVDSVERLTFRQCTFGGARGGRQLVAGPATPVRDVSVEDCDFRDITDGSWGVELVAVDGASVAGCSFRGAEGASAARAIRIGRSSSGVVVEDNDLAGLVPGQEITDRAADTVVRGNRGLR